MREQSPSEKQLDEIIGQPSSWTLLLLSALRMVAGITLMRHGLQKVLGFPGDSDPNFQTALGGLAGIVALPGGVLMILGLFTRAAAIVLSVVMAAAYFGGSFQKGYLWTQLNGGESVVFYCVVFLFLGAAGGGSLSLDRWLFGKGFTNSYASPEWTPRSLSVARIMIGFLFFQHGSQKLFGFPDSTPDHNFAALRAWAGPFEFIGGILIMLGLFTRPTAFILSGQMAVAYFVRLPSRGTFWNSLIQADNAIYFCFIFLFMWAAGGGPWSLDALLKRKLNLRAPSASGMDTMNPR